MSASVSDVPPDTCTADTGLHGDEDDDNDDDDDTPHSRPPTSTQSQPMASKKSVRRHPQQLEAAALPATASSRLWKHMCSSVLRHCECKYALNCIML